MSTRVEIIPTRPADSWAWMRPDLARLALLLGTSLAVYLLYRPRFLGISPGDLQAQLLFGLLGLPVLFGLAVAVQARLTRRRRALRVPSGGADAVLQAGYYVLNGPIEELFFLGLLQGGLSALSAPVGFLVATAIYVLYHRIGAWSWLDVAATALLGIPLGLAFWLLPGPPSLLGVSLAHIGATCGFLGPGPLLLRRLRLV